MRLVVPGQVRQPVDQDAAEPGYELGLALAEEPLEVGMRLEERLLHDVGRVELRPQGTADQGAGHQAEVVPVQLQQPSQRRVVAGAGLLQESLGDDVVRGH